jgi:hypothetical protein
MGVRPLKFVTLGPTGSCHENAVHHYFKYHELEAELELSDNLVDELERLRDGAIDYIVQCSAHLSVHIMTEKYHPQVVVADTFLFPTKDIVLLERADVVSPQVLGLPKPTEGYLNGISYPRLEYETSKPVVGKNLLAGKYDAGITTMEYHVDHPGKFRIRKHVGPVLTTWLVYGRGTAFDGQLRGAAPRGFFRSGV